MQMKTSEDNSGGNEAEVELKRAKLTLPTLDAWYDNQHPRGDAAGKSPRPPLVVIVEDFEGFGAAVMQDFILNLSEYHRRGALPFVLVLGVATTAAVVHRALPHPVSKLLSIEKFSGQKSTELLTRLVEDVALDPWSEGVSFRLGGLLTLTLRITPLLQTSIHDKTNPTPAGRALDALLEIFTYNDFAVKRFLAGYKFCLLEHFRRSPLPSLLCTEDSKSRRRRINRLLTDDQVMQAKG